MLYIDDKKLKITKQEIFVGSYILNNEKGYNVHIGIEFINIDNNEKGYINLDAGYEKTNDIKAFLNREYNGIPFENDNQHIYFETYDTEKFLDTEIEEKIIIKLKDIKDDKVEAYFELNDELIKIKYDGYLNINSEITRETFSSKME